MKSAHKHHFGTIVVVIAGLLVGPSAISQQADLSPRFDTQVTHRFKVESRSTVSRSIPEFEQQLSQTNEFDFYLSRVIRRVDEQTIEASLIFDRIVLRTQAPNLFGELQDVRYDTGIKDLESGEIRGRSALSDTEFLAMQYAQVLDPLIGNAIEMTVEPNGTIVAVRVPAEAGDESLFSLDMIKDRFLPLFQTHPVGGNRVIGETWTVSSEQDSGLGFGVVSTTKWTLFSVEAGIARIQIDNTFAMGEIEHETGIALRDSTGEGTVRWNLAAGVLDELTSSQIIAMGGRAIDAGGVEVSLTVSTGLRIIRNPEPWRVPPASPQTPPASTPE